MNTARILQQQIVQLKWHVLASVGLIMVLPLEEAVINYREGIGFYNSCLTLSAVWLAPLLAALLACVNVQADLDPKRDPFWRSKPVNIPGFITIKFFTGLVMSLGVIACPILFTLITTSLAHGNPIKESLFIILIIILISFLTYSLCFFCNVLVRKTAQAWLIGITISCFVLLLPFVLPLNVKDISTDLQLFKGIFGAFLVVTLGITALAFAISILAVKHNWQVHTRVRGLLWAGAGLVFAIILLFSRQVANIKILDQQQLPENEYRFNIKDGKVVIPNKYEISLENGSIAFQEINPPSLSTIAALKVMKPQYEVETGLHCHITPDWPGMEYQRGTQSYYFRIYAYYKTNTATRRPYKTMYLRSFQDREGCAFPVASLDLSEYLHENDFSNNIHLIEDKSVILLNKYCLVVDISDPNAMEIIESRPVRGSFRFGPDDRFALLPIESIDMQDRIKLTIDLRQAIDLRQDFYTFHQDNGIGYIRVSKEGITRYDVTGWDDTIITGRLRDKRPFTVLETLFGGMGWYSHYIIQDNKLYCYSQNKLMVFDIASPRIRKLGHFERLYIDFEIEDIHIDEHGDILLLTSHSRKVKDPDSRYRFLRVSELILLKNPQETEGNYDHSRVGRKDIARPSLTETAPQTTTIPLSYGWDVETNAFLNSNIWSVDFFWSNESETEKRLITLHGTKAAIVKGKRFEDITAKYIKRKYLQPVSILQSYQEKHLEPGTVVVFQTFKGTVGKLVVEGYRSLHDLDFFEASIFSEKWKELAKEREDHPECHIQIRWCVYK